MIEIILYFFCNHWIKRKTQHQFWLLQYQRTSLPGYNSYAVDFNPQCNGSIKVLIFISIIQEQSCAYCIFIFQQKLCVHQQFINN